MDDLNIAPLCIKFGKRSNAFKQLKVAEGKTQFRVGCQGTSMISGEIVPDFLAWLHPTVRRVLYAQDAEVALRYAQETLTQGEVK
jgi:hypothetical protein